MIETCLFKMLIDRDVKGAEEYVKGASAARKKGSGDLSATSKPQLQTSSKIGSTCRNW